MILTFISAFSHAESAIILTADTCVINPNFPNDHPVLGWAIPSPQGTHTKTSGMLIPTPTHLRTLEFQRAWGCEIGESCYNSRYDFNSDGAIGGIDYAAFGKQEKDEPHGDHTISIIEKGKRLPSGKCVTVNYNERFFTPLQHMYQACYRPETNEYSIWAGPAIKVERECP